mmetsp:Transcript_69052/g.192215  ORF Transcript_69052/g.192215 Transcript_69052/m.192215 type:complete len:299 (-) Transcript_69052:321-1217(-)
MVMPSRWIWPSVGSKPLPVTSYATSPDHIFTIVIFPSVRVPVLSLQMMDAEPKVSTAASLRTSTFFFTMSEQPIEREIVTQSGMPSGMAATANVTAIKIMYSHDSPSRSSGFLVSSATPRIKTTTHTPIARMPMRDPRRSTFTCKGVALDDVSGKQPHFFFPALESPAMRRAMLPIRVFIPVSTTTPLALPLVTLQAEKTIDSGVNFSTSPGFDAFFFANFGTSSGSPVRHISATFKSSATNRRMSAGTTSPVPNNTMSPATNVVVSTLSSAPSRMREIVACDIFDNASKASPALLSV